MNCVIMSLYGFWFQTCNITDGNIAATFCKFMTLYHKNFAWNIRAENLYFFVSYEQGIERYLDGITNKSQHGFFFLSITLWQDWNWRMNTLDFLAENSGKNGNGHMKNWKWRDLRSRQYSFFKLIPFTSGCELNVRSLCFWTIFWAHCVRTAGRVGQSANDIKITCFPVSL